MQNKSKTTVFEDCLRNWSTNLWLAYFFIKILYKRWLKGRVHCFSMQIVMNKCFLLNPEKKKLAQIRFVVFEKNPKNAPLISKTDVAEPKARLF